MKMTSWSEMKTGRCQIEHALVRTAYFSAKPAGGLAVSRRPVGAFGAGGSFTSDGLSP
jgi:hypothetical protein